MYVAIRCSIEKLNKMELSGKDMSTRMRQRWIVNRLEELFQEAEMKDIRYGATLLEVALFKRL